MQRQVSCRAKDVLFQPGMNNEIHNMVSQCPVCNDYLSKQQKEPMMTPEIPTRPLEGSGTRPVYVGPRELSNYS